MNTAGVPVYEPDIFCVDAIVDPYPHYQRLRDLGPVVWLTKHRVYALPRYGECKAVLLDDKTFLSGRGVALIRITNRMSGVRPSTAIAPNTISDASFLRAGLLPRALRAISDNVDATAATVVETALNKGEIDGVHGRCSRPAAGRSPRPHRLAPRSARPPHRLGRRHVRHPGPLNWQAIKAMPVAFRMLRFARRAVRERTFLDGSMADELMTAADEGKLSHAECPALMVDYLAPSMTPP